MKKNSQIVIIGGGIGGYAAALKAAILGAEVTLIEKDQLGGTCLNRGCIPTKSFLNSIYMLDSISKAKGFGMHCEEADPDFGVISDRKNAIVSQLNNGVAFLLKKRGVTVIKGTARLLDSKTVSIETDGEEELVITAENIILAAGSEPIIPEIFKYNGTTILTSDEIINIAKIPKSLIIVGGGAIGCEFGQFFSRMGCAVTIIEAMEHILPEEDVDAAQVLCEALKRQGITIYTGTSVRKVDTGKDSVSVILSDGGTLSAELTLVSIGRKPAIDNIGIENLGLYTKKAKLLVNEHMQTNVNGIYAIGDIVDSPSLAHVAMREGIVAAENIMGRDSRIDYKAVTHCIYTDPEIAGVGITENQSKRLGIESTTGIFNFRGLGKAVVMDKTVGFVKIIVDENDRIIGACIVGPHATDLISELATAVHFGLTARQMGEVIHPHPTLSEAIMEALHDVRKESIHSF